MEPRQLDNLTQYPLRNGMVQGDSHDRLAFFLATTHVHEGNVDSFLTQYCPDFADHPRNVFVLEENHVLRRFDVYVMPIDLDQTWLVVGSDSGTTGRQLPMPILADNRHKAGEVKRSTVTYLSDLESPRLRYSSGIHVVERFLHPTFQHTLEHGGCKETSVAVGKLPFIVNREILQGPIGDSHYQPAQCLRQRQEGLKPLQRLV